MGDCASCFACVCDMVAGDSRAVLCRNARAVPLTDDHKPEREDEAVSRICNAPACMRAVRAV